MNLKGIILSEILQREKDIASLTSGNFKKKKKGHQNKVEKLLKDGRNRGWQKVQTFSYKVNKI